MKYPVILLLWASLLSAAVEQDALSPLTLLAYGGLGELKYQIGGQPGGQNPDLDDSAWPKAYPGFKWDLPYTNVWFRTTVNVPQNIGGFSLVGRSMKMILYIDNGADVFVNGDSLGTFRWGPVEYTIAKALKPGDRFVIAIRAINNPGFGKLYTAQVEFSGLGNFQKQLQTRIWSIRTARQLAEKYSDHESRWLTEINRLTERIVNSDAFCQGDEQGLLRYIDREKQSLTGLKKEMEKKFQLYCAGYAHIDLAWLWSWPETVEVAANTTRSVFNIMDKYPDFKYSMGQAHAYQWLEESYPDLFEKIKTKYKEGRWEIMGGMWVEPDCNLPSGESLVRQILYGKRYFRKKFGEDVTICWIPDSFGYNWNLAQLLARSGFTAFITHKINWNDTNKFPYRFFWWQGPDSSRIMSYIPRSGYGHDLNPDQMLDFIDEEKTELNLGKELVLYGVGNHGGGPTLAMLENAMSAINSAAYPQVKLTTSKDFFDHITPQEQAKLPTWNSELYLEYHRGTFTSQANAKKNNRQGEAMIQAVEKLATLATLYQQPYPDREIFQIWKTLMFNQFHDILPGSSIHQVYCDAEREYAETRKLTTDLLSQTLTTLCCQIDTRGQGEALVVFNPSSWERTNPVELALNRLEAQQDWTVQDDENREIAVQKIEPNWLGAKLIFLAKDIPPFGYKSYRLLQKTPHASTVYLAIDENELQNRMLRITLDTSTGLLTQITDKIAHRDILQSGRGNLLQLLPDDNKDAWDIKFTRPAIDLDHANEVQVVEQGPVRTTVKIVHSYLGAQKSRVKPTEDFPSSFFTQYISLYDEMPYVEVRNTVDWWEEDKVLKVNFPLAIESDAARYEIPYGSIARSTGFTTPFEKARFEVPAQRWADLSDGHYGVALLNDCKYGYDIKYNIMRLSLLRAPSTPDPTADRGRHEFKYALYPHPGDYQTGRVVNQAVEFNEPLLVQRCPAHIGSLPAQFSYIQIEPDGVILNNLKKAEDGQGWILRIYDANGKTSNAVVHFNIPVRKVKEVNLIEDDLAPITVQKNSFSFVIRANEIRTFQIE